MLIRILLLVFLTTGIISCQEENASYELKTADDSVAYASKILKEQMNPFINFDEDLEPDLIEDSKDDADKGFNENIYRSVDELELSVRSSNCLKNARIHTIYQLVQKTDGAMLKTKNFGRKSLNEIRDILVKMGLSLGMKIEGWPPPGWDPNNPIKPASMAAAPAAAAPTDPTNPQ